MVREPCLLIALFCGGCAADTPRLAVSPKLVSSDWSQEVSAGLPSAARLGEQLGSPELQALIDRAHATSPTLGAARARIDAATAELRIARSSGLPVIGLSGSFGSGATASNRALDFGDSLASLDLSFAPDMFGRISTQTGAARARAQAAFADLSAETIGLDRQIARAFVERATLARRVRLLDQSITQASELDRVIRVRRREGAASRVEVGLQTIRLRRLEADRTRLVEALSRTRSALALLVGDEAPVFDTVAADQDTLVTPPVILPRPVDLIRSRPEVVAAEARLRASGGDVEAARRALLPDVRLSAGALLAGGPLMPLAEIGASILAPIFGGDRLAGEVARTSARQREAAHFYRLAALTALAEVEDALSAFTQAGVRIRLLEEVVAEAEVTARLARRQYLEGGADLQNLLDAQDLLISAQDAQALGRQEHLEASILLLSAAGDIRIGMSG